MAAYQFINAAQSDVGTTPVDIYTVPANKKSIMIGCSVANTTGATLPVDVRLIKADATSVSLAKAVRVDGGTTTDIMSGKKLVMQTGEKIQIVSKLDNSFDCVVSILEDVD